MACISSLWDFLRKKNVFNQVELKFFLCKIGDRSFIEYKIANFHLNFFKLIFFPMKKFTLGVQQYQNYWVFVSLLNLVLCHFWKRETMVKHEKVSKYFAQDWIILINVNRYIIKNWNKKLNSAYIFKKIKRLIKFNDAFWSNTEPA